MHLDPRQEYRLCSDLLDSLDDLYDKRDRAEWWVKRLIHASWLAARGTHLEPPLHDALAALEAIKGEDDARAVLAATDPLRLVVADRWAELYPSLGKLP